MSLTALHSSDRSHKNPTWRIPFRTLPEQNDSLADEVLNELSRILRSGDYVGSAEPEITRQFESDLAAYSSCTHAAAVSSGTQALELALRALNIGPGDEVITVSNTFVATITAILALGAKPVFVDVRSEDGLINFDLIEDAVTPRTKAILPVHLYGNAVAMPALLQIAEQFNLAVVEDCAHAIGTRLQGRQVGTFGDAGCFSFYAGKNLGAVGEGGAILTNRADVAERIRLLRNHGGYHEGEPTLRGTNARIGALEAAVLKVKLKYLEGWNESRRQIAESYIQQLSGIAGLELLALTSGATHSYHLFVIRVADRVAFMAALKEKGIECRVHYPVPIHVMAPFSDLARTGSLPVTEEFCSSIVSLPIHPDLPSDMLAEITESIREFLLATGENSRSDAMSTR